MLCIEKNVLISNRFQNCIVGYSELLPKLVFNATIAMDGMVGVQPLVFKHSTISNDTSLRSNLKAYEGYDTFEENKLN